MTSSTKVTKKVYVFDTSALLALHRHNTQVIQLPQAIWDTLAQMIKEGKITSHFYVYEEVVNEKAENPDMITEWLIPKKRYFERETAEQAFHVAKIISKFPKLIDPEREKEQADPWVVAQAIILNKQTTLLENVEYVVVTQENPNSTKKIPAACRHYKVRAIALKEFFEENKIAIEVASK